MEASSHWKSDAPAPTLYRKDEERNKPPVTATSGLDSTTVMWTIPQ